MDKISKMARHVAKSISNASWLDLCKEAQSFSDQDYAGIVATVLYTVEHKAKDIRQAKDLLLISNTLTMARSSQPIVHYVIKKELAEELSRSVPIDGNMLVKDVFTLPYPTLAISIEGAKENDWFAICKPDKAVQLICNDFSMSLFDDNQLNHITDANVMLNLYIKTLAYLTNNQDIITKKKKIEIPNENPSKQRKKKPRTLEVIEGEIGGIFAKNIKLFNEQQNAPGNKDEVDPITGRKMKPHMRAGHWHTYRHGPGRTLTKLVFVHACAVNASEIARGTTLMVDIE